MLNIIAFEAAIAVNLFILVVKALENCIHASGDVYRFIIFQAFQITSEEHRRYYRYTTFISKPHCLASGAVSFVEDTARLCSTFHAFFDA